MAITSYVCKKCGKQIPLQYPMCPFCKTPRPPADELLGRTPATPVNVKMRKKKKKHPILGAVLLVIGIIIVIAAIGGGGKKDKPQRVSESNPPRQEESFAPTQSVSPEGEVFTVGDSVSLNDIVVTLVDVSESEGANYMTPSEGNVFVICEFTIENNSDKDIAVSSIMSFEAYVDEYSTSMNLSAMMSSDKPQLDGSIASGKKMNGVIGYEIGVDWKSIEIRFTPDFWSGNEFIFTCSK